MVAPLVGARVEIMKHADLYETVVVAPLVGARVEILSCNGTDAMFLVAPLVGARVEITEFMFDKSRRVGRSPRGSAD